MVDRYTHRVRDRTVVHDRGRERRRRGKGGTGGDGGGEGWGKSPIDERRNRDGDGRAATSYKGRTGTGTYTTTFSAAHRSPLPFRQIIRVGKVVKKKKQGMTDVSSLGAVLL